MSTVLTMQYCDNSTYANFYSWSTAISAALQSWGWKQTSDTGQVMWSGMNITAVSMSGSNMTCTYSSLTGLPLAVGRVLTVTGWTGANVQNNGTFVITALGSGTWTAVNINGVNVSSGGTGIVTAATAPPGNNLYLYEIWYPNDGLTPFYLTIQYGNTNGANNPGLLITISTSTSGTGTPTGFIIGPFTSNMTSAGAPSSLGTYECRFSGGPSRANFLLWRGVNGYNTQYVGIERSVNSSGSYTSTHVTLASAGGRGLGWTQQSLVLAVGPAPAASTYNGYFTTGLMPIRTFNYSQGTNPYFNGIIPFEPTSPFVGYFDYPLTIAGAVPSIVMAEGCIFTTTLYGTPVTYFSTVSGSLAGVLAGYAFCMRYD